MRTNFWFSWSTNCRNWSTSPLKVLMCCLLSLTCIATSSIIWSKVRWAPPDNCVITASPDTKSLRRAQMYWNLRWFLTDERKSKRFTASPRPLNPAISRVHRKTIWQCGGTASNCRPSSDCCPSVAFLQKFFDTIIIGIDFMFSLPGYQFCYTIAIYLFVSHSSTFDFSQLPSSVFTHSSPDDLQSFEMNGIFNRHKSPRWRRKKNQLKFFFFSSGANEAKLFPNRV